MRNLIDLLMRRRDREWEPGRYRVVRTEAGANVNYDCYCGCDAGFAFEDVRDEQAAESCCCGNLILVGADAAARLRQSLADPTGYRIAETAVALPSGAQAQVALAIPRR